MDCYYKIGGLRLRSLFKRGAGAGIANKYTNPLASFASTLVHSIGPHMKLILFSSNRERFLSTIPDDYERPVLREERGSSCKEKIERKKPRVSLFHPFIQPASPSA
jgi:hypothetical protein